MAATATLELIVKLRNNAAAGLKDFQKGIKANEKAIRNTGLALVAMGAAGGLALASAAKSAANFEKGMREVNTLVNLSEANLKGLSDQTLALSASMGVNAVDATKALYQTISASVPPAEAIGFLETAMRAAIGGVTDTETAVDGLTTVINAFGLKTSDAEHVADVMFTTVKRGKTNFAELSQSMFQAAPVAAAMGVSFEEIAAATASATKAGVPTRVVMTGLRAAMVALAKPTTDMSKLLNDIGFESGSAATEALGLQGTLAALLEEVGSTDALIDAGLQAESLSTVLGILGDNAGTFADDFDAAMNQSAGASAAAFDEMAKSSTFAMDVAKANFEAVKITIGQELLPVITKLLEGVAKAAGAFLQWAKDNPALRQTLVAVAAAISLVAFGIGVVLVGAVVAAGISFTALNVALAGIPLLIGLIVTGIVLLVKNWDTFTNALKIGINFMADLLENFINNFLSNFVNPIIRGLNKLGEFLGFEIDEIQISLGRMATAADTTRDVTVAAYEDIIAGTARLGTMVTKAADDIEDSFEVSAKAVTKFTEQEIGAMEELAKEIQVELNQMEADRQIDFANREILAANQIILAEQTAADIMAAAKMENDFQRLLFDDAIKRADEEIAKKAVVVQAAEDAAAALIAANQGVQGALETLGLEQEKIIEIMGRAGLEFNAAKTELDLLADALGEANISGELFENVMNLVGERIGETNSAFNAFMGNISGAGFQDPNLGITGIGITGREGIKGLKDQITAAQAQLAEKQGRLGGLTDPFADVNLRNTLTAQIAALISEISRLQALVAGGPGGRFKGFGFASGGIVPGPSGSAQLAVVHGGERVIPSRNGGGGGTNIMLVNRGTIIGVDEGAAWVARSLQEAKRRGMV